MIASLLTTALLALIPAQQTPEDGRGQGLFDKDWHAARRQALREAFLEKAEDKEGVIVLRGQGPLNDYREFRQDNNFWYLTGVSTPEAVYVTVPKTGEEYLLVPRVGPMDERWQGDLIDPAEATKLTGIAVCTKLDKDDADYGNLDALLAKLAAERKSFYIEKQPAENWMMSRDNLQGWAATMKRDPFDTRNDRGEQFGVMLESKYAGVKSRDVTQLIDAMRLIKTPEEIEAMRMACKVSGIAHSNAMRQTLPGDYEWQIAARMTGDMLENGGMGAAYMAIVGSAGNACMLHYPTNNRKTEASDLVLIDYGAEYRYYVADITRSWPLDKKFSARHREVYQAVYDAQEAAFKLCKPGSTLNEVSAAASKVIADRGFGQMWHGTSHWLGMATHDVGVYQVKLAPGMAFTVEPGIYLPEENFGVRIEDVVVITKDGYELISSMIPRSIADIEKLRAEAHQTAKP
jgi:Xaa-Pro aminopeptidase